ncbi:VOC family protein [Glutamicibacter sp. JL.03c]|uniref:VOC family protein n=1 Tax=Glutamicibacter sp. JL.03c TaxID=2984842 RepID=UPI0021F750CA|nr:VOC family protein [Glutamicibacter sp. JL.03c]UYQ76477.1 VOC family protein [Glutamicibacter sp. JL.03c]
MYWENLVFDAVSPRQQGRHWEELLGSETRTDNEGGFETRIALPEGQYLDICFPTVTDPQPESQRVFPVLASTADGEKTTVDYQSATRGEYAEATGRTYFVLGQPSESSRPLELIAVEMLSADPERDAIFWAKLTGYQAAEQSSTVLRHPAGLGPMIVLVPEKQPKTSAKSSVHLDLRLEAGDDAEQILAMVLDTGATKLQHAWGEVPWQVFLDPSGNEFCILPAPRH